MSFSYDQKFLLLRISFMYFIDLHPYSHDCFSKILRPFCVRRNWWIIVLFIQSNNLRIRIVSQKYWDFLQPNSHDRFSKISRTFYARRKSWIIVAFLHRTLKEKLLFFLINTLLLHIPLLTLTDGQNHLQRDEYTCCAWAGGTFFQLCCCVRFWFWRGISFGFTYSCS